MPHQQRRQDTQDSKNLRNNAQVNTANSDKIHTMLDLRRDSESARLWQTRGFDKLTQKLNTAAKANWSAPLKHRTGTLNSRASLSGQKRDSGHAIS